MGCRTILLARYTGPRFMTFSALLYFLSLFPAGEFTISKINENPSIMISNISFFLVVFYLQNDCHCCTWSFVKNVDVPLTAAKLKFVSVSLHVSFIYTYIYIHIHVSCNTCYICVADQSEKSGRLFFFPNRVQTESYYHLAENDLLEDGLAALA